MREKLFLTQTEQMPDSMGYIHAALLGLPWAFSLSNPFSVINNRRQMEALGFGFVFFSFLAGIYYYENFVIKLAAIKQRKDTDA